VRKTPGLYFPSGKDLLPFPCLLSLAAGLAIARAIQPGVRSHPPQHKRSFFFSPVLYPPDVAAYCPSSFPPWKGLDDPLLLNHASSFAFGGVYPRSPVLLRPEPKPCPLSSLFCRPPIPLGFAKYDLFFPREKPTFIGLFLRPIQVHAFCQPANPPLPLC